ncbi:MAG: hypothetical protein H3C43_01595 [Leptonema sp. (in: Bacteria)]|nr:hypothetical protein [Leptonema sp. (in: bacteria)]
MVEQEMVGNFTGRRLYFDSFDSLVATAEVNRQCNLKLSEGKILCIDSIHYLSKEKFDSVDDDTVSFTITFRYDNDQSVKLDYVEDGVSPSWFRFFKGGETKGAAIQLYGDSRIPLSNVNASMMMVVIRERFNSKGDQVAQYFEERRYSYLGFSIGNEQTHWQRVAK